MEEAAQLAGVAFAQSLGAHNPLRQAIDLYTHSAGIETGYGFFAPNVPDNYKLVFELSYKDGSTETVLPTVANDATGIRLVDLLDRIEPIDYPELRELVMRMLAYSAWREHPGATEVRAVFGSIHLPTLAAFKSGEKESYETLFAYDFRFTPARDEP